MASLKQTLKDGHAVALIDYEQLGYLVRRGQYLVHSHHGALAIFRVSKTTYTIDVAPNGQPRGVFRVTGYAFTINARGRVSRQEVIKRVFSYTGGRLLSELGLFAVVPGKETAALTVRGQRMLDMFGGKEFAHLLYNGDYTYYNAAFRAWVRSSIRGRIMIDVRMSVSVAGGGGLSSHNDDALMKYEVPHERYQDRLFLMMPYISGYDLHCHKRWGKFHVDYMSPIQWNDTAFDRLILPNLPATDADDDDDADETEDVADRGSSNSNTRRTVHNPTKDAIQSLVENFSQGAHRDLIEGKNSGLNGLLRGPPGLGKTLLAEVTAEHLKRPLMYISAGSLGLTATTIETQFQRFVDLSKRWSAILLIDEVDCFIERRSPDALERNAIVGCFLQILERQTGIVFMTTNRSADIDHAVHSRLHFLIDFDALTTSVRTTIWRNMLSDAHHPHAATVGRRIVRNTVLNGRQLRSLFNIASSLARRDSLDASGITEVHIRGALQLNGRHMNTTA
jgi:hypothetical protein